MIFETEKKHIFFNREDWRERKADYWAQRSTRQHIAMSQGKVLENLWTPNSIIPQNRVK
jgi:hypothetical protein